MKSRFTEEQIIKILQRMNRDEFLNETLFLDVEDAQVKVDKWRKYYNQERPHSSLDYKTPNEFEKEFKQTA